MPLLIIDTNLPAEKIPKDFLDRMTQVYCESMSKPTDLCCIQIRPNQMMLWGCKSDPCAVITVLSIGRLGIEENKNHSKAIMTELNKLGISGDRMFINFVGPKPEDVGFNFTTFHGAV